MAEGVVEEKMVEINEQGTTVTQNEEQGKQQQPRKRERERGDDQRRSTAILEGRFTRLREK